MYRIILLYSLHIFSFSVNSVTENNLRLAPFVTQYGYPFENHTVQTGGGYLLGVHRIPYGAKNNKTQWPPVLIMHGILSSSADFLALGPDKSIPFLLADAGYDVWMGNCRGTTWSRRHIKIDPDKENAKFYNFSFHEIAIFDLPAKIDYILKVTKRKSLNYIGHSQGTTTLLSTLPKYNKNIKMVSALAPVDYLKHSVSLAVELLEDIDEQIIHFISENNRKSKEMFSNNSPLTLLLRSICPKPLMRKACTVIIFELAGFDLGDFDKNLLSTMLINFPVKQMLYFEQIRKSDRFAMYDFGPVKNLERYKQIDPPIYNLSQITAPVILYYSLNDYLAAFKVVSRLSKELPNATLKLIQWMNFNHIDHLIGRDVVELLYNEVINDIKSITQEFVGDC